MVLRRNRTLFERDFIIASERFPKLKYSWHAKSKMWVISGELDICDTVGVYWGTFQIIMLVPRSYPYCVPIVIEESQIIPRDIDWHISPEGICCLDANHELIAMSKKGINISDFIANKVYTFFANQIHKLEGKQYAGAEYAHHIKGVIQYYVERLNIPSAEITLQMLKSVLFKKGQGRNDKRPCGSGLKLKNCHIDSIRTIKSFGSLKVQKDIEDIEKFLLKD